MKVIRHTLVSDGPTDANLIPIIDWTLRHAAGVPLSEGVRADFWRLHEKPQNLTERLLKAVELFPCEILFVHRDAEREPTKSRIDEIHKSSGELWARGIQLPTVAVIPVRMLEAWLCFNEDAVRRASGNPNSKIPLGLPPLNRIESCPDPKGELKKAILIASERKGRRLKKFNAPAAFWQIVDFIEDFSPLRELPPFRAFENSIRTLKENRWKAGFYG